MTFTIDAGFCPFLIAELNPGDRIYAERDAMVAMENGIDIRGKMSNGIISSFARSFFTNENFFHQEFTTSKTANVILSPRTLGDLFILNVDSNKQYCLNDSAFFAAESSVELENIVNRSIMGAMFGNTGGFVISKTKGYGQLVVTGFGNVQELEVTEDNQIVLDNSHVVAWDSNLSYTVEVLKSKKSGFFGNLVNSQTTGEGLVLRFKGNGKVIFSSRNAASFMDLIALSHTHK